MSQKSFASAIWPVRQWLIFCAARGWPWWVVRVGVEGGFLVVAVSGIILMARFIK